jgi:hypothetical protein
VRTSKAGVRVGGLALALGLGAVVITRRRYLALADPSRSTSTSSGETVASAVADTATPHFAFTGQPSRNTTVAVSVLRGVGVVTDFLGIDFGTQIAPLISFARPPSFLLSDLDVQCNDFAGQPVYVIRSGSPHG